MSENVLGIPDDHYRSITVTTLAALAGLAAGLVSATVVSDPKANMGLFILGAFVLGQLPIIQLLGIDLDDFSAKDHLYVVFMSFSMWFVTWTILLTASVSL